VNIELVVTDLDQTLWGADGVIHDESRRALRTLADAGVPVLAATGRGHSSALRRLRLNGVVIPAVLLNGSLGRDFHDGSTFLLKPMTKEYAAAALDASESVDIEPCVYVDDSREIVVGSALHHILTTYGLSRTGHAKRIYGSLSTNHRSSQCQWRALIALPLGRFRRVCRKASKVTYFVAIHTVAAL
jgi:hydroxymethylpyrimidine pyrophosphatase-like HAD family hydrolase